MIVTPGLFICQLALLHFFVALLALLLKFYSLLVEVLPPRGSTLPSKDSLILLLPLTEGIDVSFTQGSSAIFLLMVDRGKKLSSANIILF